MMPVGSISVGCVSVGSVSVGSISVERPGRGRSGAQVLHPRRISHSAIDAQIVGGIGVFGDHEIKGRLIEQGVDRFLHIVDPTAKDGRTRTALLEEGENLMSFRTFEDQPNVSQADL